MITFNIPGSPVGKGRPRFARRGAFVQAYTPGKTVGYENLVKLYANEAMGGKPLLEGPVMVDMAIFCEPPASWSKKRRLAALAELLFPQVKPDLDNCLKLVLDALNGIVYTDDRQVCDAVIRKRYAEKPRVVVSVKRKA